MQHKKITVNSRRVNNNQQFNITVMADNPSQDAPSSSVNFGIPYRFILYLGSHGCNEESEYSTYFTVVNQFHRTANSDNPLISHAYSIADQVLRIRLNEVRKKEKHKNYYGKLLDMSGRTINRFLPKQVDNLIDVSYLACGVYLVVVENEKGELLYREKFVVQQY